MSTYDAWAEAQAEAEMDRQAAIKADRDQYLADQGEDHLLREAFDEEPW